MAPAAVSGLQAGSARSSRAVMMALASNPTCPSAFASSIAPPPLLLSHFPLSISWGLRRDIYPCIHAS